MLIPAILVSIVALLAAMDEQLPLFFYNIQDVYKRQVVIKNGVTSVSDKAFYKCKNLSKVTIGKSVKKIGIDSFNGTKIKKVTIPKKVKEIGQDAFCLLYTSSLGNETSMQLYGIKKFGESYYFPYKVASSEIQTTADGKAKINSTLKSQSFTKSLSLIHISYDSITPMPVTRR